MASEHPPSLTTDLEIFTFSVSVSISVSACSFIRFRNFLIYVSDYDKSDPKSFKGRDLNVMTGSQLYEAFSLNAYTRVRMYAFAVESAPKHMSSVSPDLNTFHSRHFAPYPTAPQTRNLSVTQWHCT